jgi:hypothetical protein
MIRINFGQYYPNGNDLALEFKKHEELIKIVFLLLSNALIQFNLVFIHAREFS